MRQLAWLGAAALAALALTASASGGRGCAITGPVGRGASSSWILRPSGAARSIAVYIHGWTATNPRDWHLARMNHLCDQGSLVVFPTYQTGSYADTFAGSVEAFRRGLQAAFRRLGATRLPVVASGYSLGATLGFYYAANARRWGLPVPAGVYSLFPTGPIEGVPLGPLPRLARYVLLAGDRDEIVGRKGADAFWRRLAGVPAGRKQYRLIRSRPPLFAFHEAPKQTSPLALRLFWAPLDALVATVRG